MPGIPAYPRRWRLSTVSISVHQDLTATDFSCSQEKYALHGYPPLLRRLIWGYPATGSAKKVRGGPMGGCKRTSLNRKMAPARKSLATGEAGRRTRLGRGVFQVPLSAAQGQRGGDTPSKASDPDPSSIWTGSSTTNDPTGAGTKMTHRAKPPRTHVNNVISRFLLSCFGLTIPVFPMDETSSNNPDVPKGEMVTFVRGSFSNTRIVSDRGPISCSYEIFPELGYSVSNGLSGEMDP